ncbi:hypothetical protein [Bellilinea sp.]|jgi:hypothetical protein|uniref:hypothetical protein n=1 Tax=Bellilinea sp. TaxID=2838785 RepID=UPI002ADDD84B|nr:hypothetical protein [Bellilinea sp.]
MSGIKEVTISSTYFQRLLSDSSRLQAIQSALPQFMESVAEAILNEVAGQLQNNERRQSRYEASLANLSEEMRQMESEVNQRLRRMNEHWQGELQNSLRENRHEFRQRIGELDQRLTAQIQQERRERERQVQEISDRINALVADERRRDELARSWVNDVSLKAGFIANNYRHQQFAPGELDKIERDIQIARQNVLQGMPQSALSTIQRAYNDLNDLQMKLERLEKEWLLWHTAALEATRQLLAIAQSNRVCSALDMEGKPLTGFEVEVDHWTRGKLTAFETKLKKIIGRIENDEQPLSIEELREIAETAAPKLREELEQIIAEARTAVIASQLRASIAELVIQALESQGYVYDDSAYEEEDQRLGYVAKVKAFDGSEVVISISPDDENAAANHLQIHSFDQDVRTEHELLQRAKAISESLQEQGLQASQPAVTDQRADPRLRDLERVRKQAVTKSRG